jgi:hypothetical protein
VEEHAGILTVSSRKKTVFTTAFPQRLQGGLAEEREPLELTNWLTQKISLVSTRSQCDTRFIQDGFIPLHSITLTKDVFSRRLMEGRGLHSE